MMFLKRRISPLLKRWIMMFLKERISPLLKRWIMMLLKESSKSPRKGGAMFNSWEASDDSSHLRVVNSMMDWVPQKVAISYLSGDIIVQRFFPLNRKNVRIKKNNAGRQLYEPTISTHGKVRYWFMELKKKGRTHIGIGDCHGWPTDVVAEEIIEKFHDTIHSDKPKG
ncbi:hypothetical protein LAZ67_4001426 [Cordylochernes scorpioides]|uniref:Uncharacterized protein n=1 Tax=Cordylochernes scorpioides TaxID=51811 RepID=A0ABY6KBX8_9ARAC|nr:hypothetical protein LAZ67_4001426 [Cordylochernes scorpioides]